MTFSYDPHIGETFPKLATGLLAVWGLPETPEAFAAAARFEAEALARQAAAPESERPPIRAWRAAFAAMGHKPTQYRCASEALLRRLRKEGALPRLHPLVDLCNAVSAAFALPVAAFDSDRIAGGLRVRPAVGDETYRPFQGADEAPSPGEIVFVDDAGAAHARRWTHRQSAASAVSAATRNALIVIEGLHDDAAADVAAARDALAAELSARGASVQTGRLLAGVGAFHAARPRS